MSSDADKVSDLWNFAVEHPDGFTWANVHDSFGWATHRSKFFRIVRKLRIMLGADDTVNLICEPQGSCELWKYRLVGTYDPGMQPWHANRMTDLEARLETMLSVATSIVAATDGRSTDGRKSRLVRKTVGRLIEDLQDMKS